MKRPGRRQGIGKHEGSTRRYEPAGEVRKPYVPAWCYLCAKPHLYQFPCDALRAYQARILEESRP